MRLRTGNHVGRTIYAIDGNGIEILIGVLDTRELAAEAVRRWNDVQDRLDRSQPAEDGQ